jgi:hypothetical protein
MKQSIYVVDNFYIEPERVRLLGLRSATWTGASHQGDQYYSPKRVHLLGSHSLAGMEPSEQNGQYYSSETVKAYYTTDILRCFERILGFEISFDPARMGFGVFAFYGTGSKVEETTHFDDTDWSAIVYLVPPDACRGGITFYRHRCTGLHGPPTRAQLDRLGISDMATFLSKIYLPDKKDPEAWEETTHVAMRFNRLVLLNGGRLFHRASSAFGVTPGDGRLTQRFFFDQNVGNDAC